MVYVMCIHLSSVTEPPTNVRTVQQSPTSIRVSWTPPSDATGYSIDYTSNGGSSYNVTVSGGTTNERLLTGLENGAIYIISIMATAEASLPSVSVEAEMRVPLGKVFFLTMTLCACECMYVSSQFQLSPLSTWTHQ